MGIIWEEPPAKVLNQHRVGSLGEWMAQLAEHPMEWGRVDKEWDNPSSARAAAGNIRNGKVKGFKKGDFEAIAHEGKVWARYIKGMPLAKGDDGDDGSADDDERKSYPPKVRAWAKLQGLEVKPGRLPDSLVKRYEDATGDLRPPNRLSAVE